MKNTVKEDIDIEKQGVPIQTTPIDSISQDGQLSTLEAPADGQSAKPLGVSGFKWKNLWQFEDRGILRVRDDEKIHPRPIHDFFHMFSLWFSINVQAISVVIGALGPLAYGLGWVDCIFIVIFANALASAGVAYVSTFGPESGIRTMVLGRYFMGYWPAKLTAACNVVQQVGFGTIACIFTGQMITAVSGGGLSLVVGCVIAALCVGLVATFGIHYLNKMEKFGYIPQMIALFVLIGTSSRHYDTNAISTGDRATVNTNRASFFALTFASIIGFSAISADFYVYYPKSHPKWMTFVTTWSGIWVALIFTNIIGVGIATGIPNIPEWSAAYDVSSGELLLACYKGVGNGFASFCVVVLSLGSITQNAPCTYSAALTIQALGRYAEKVPRWVWCVLITIVELVLSVAGRNALYTIFQNFLPLMAYWICPYLTIVIEEHLLFHKLPGKPFDWSIYNNQNLLPHGIAAFLSFLIGFAGAVIGMYQIWYTGPVASMLAGSGGDIGEWLAVGFTGLVFPPLRWLELRKFGR